MGIPKANYDFADFEDIMRKIKKKPSVSAMNELKNELNRFFKDSVCKDIIYTNNTDKMFFGMAVMPIIHGDDIPKILQTNNKYRVDEYYIELDSKLFSEEGLNLTNRELVAILLHEVGHLVKDTTPIEEVRKTLDVYLMKNHESLVISDSIHYKEILAYGIKDAIRKTVSMFAYNDNEIIADEFVTYCGYGKDLETAFNKIVKNSFKLNREVDNRMIALSWTLRLYKEVKLKRIPALRTIKKARELTGSKLEKREIDNLARRLERIDDDALLESTMSMKTILNAKLKEMKYKGVRSLEDDIFEYNMRLRNVETEDEAFMLLRQVNNRIAIIDDYVSTESMSDKEKERWYNTLEKFYKIREELSKKTVYKIKDFNIVVNYPDIRDR